MRQEFIYLFIFAVTLSRNSLSCMFPLQTQLEILLFITNLASFVPNVQQIHELSQLNHTYCPSEGRNGPEIT